MKINSTQEAENYLYSFISNGSLKDENDASIKRMLILLKKLGNPQDKLKIVHIAGTSGKTSTAYYVSALLLNSGKKVGLTVSPHIDSVKERIQINGDPIDNEIFCKRLEEFSNLISDCNIDPSFFEIVTSFAYWFFYLEKVNYAVIETGVGGLFDSTNVSERRDKVCVITDIGFDHMHILGGTIEEISYQKAGIIKTNNHVLMHKQSPKIMKVIDSAVKKQNATIETLNIKNEPEIALPSFQKRNLHLAYKASKYISSRDGFVLSNLEDLYSLKIPGRMDTIKLKDKSTLIMDGAHNKQKIDSLVASFKIKYPHKKSLVMLALKSDKEYKYIIDSLAEITEYFIFTKIDSIKGLSFISQDLDLMQEYAINRNIKSKIVTNNKVALKKLISNKSEIKIIVGSFYLLGQIRKFL